MPHTKNPGNRHPHAPTDQSRRSMNALVQRHGSRDPYAITAPVDPTYRYRGNEHAYIERSTHDLYADIVAYDRESE